MNSAIIKKGMQSNQIASLSLLFFYPETYASAFSAGITETDLLSALPTLQWQPDACAFFAAACRFL